MNLGKAKDNKKFKKEFIKEAIRVFGASTIVINIEAKKRINGSYEVFTENGREPTGVDAIEWAKQINEFGVGEILLTSVDQEGTGNGFDLSLIRQISESVSIPVIACGGAGNPLI